VSLPPSFLTTTSGLVVRVNVPNGPLTLILSAAIVTSTPCGMVTGIFPTRDIVLLPFLRHVAKHFAADTGLACLAVGHHALGRGDNGHAETVHHVRDVVAALVDAQTRAADALDALDHSATGVVLQRDLELRFGIAAHGEVIDV